VFYRKSYLIQPTLFDSLCLSCFGLCASNALDLTQNIIVQRLTSPPNIHNSLWTNQIIIMNTKYSVKILFYYFIQFNFVIQLTFFHSLIKMYIFFFRKSHATSRRNFVKYLIGNRSFRSQREKFKSQKWTQITWPTKPSKETETTY